VQGPLVQPQWEGRRAVWGRGGCMAYLEERRQGEKKRVSDIVFIIIRERNC